ncbi:alpha/beta fold hydrolase [Microbacterium sp.]|uniref:alpha/beta fold hydrolase n=1 Tax=Microbacterium sp. TaxID=51671 RepID=UPI0039E68BE6
MTDSLILSAQHTPARKTPSGPPVVLIHGFASRGAADWPAEQWAQPLSAAGRDVVVIDLPGHGDSPAPGAALPTGAVLAALADAVRAAVGDAEIDLVGYSLGARLAWDLAGTSAVPVRRLVLGGISPVEPFGAVDVAAARAAADGGPAPADPLTGMILAMARQSGDPRALLDVVAGLGAEPFDPAVSPPRVPTLLLAGADDQMMQGIDALAAAIPGARLEHVPGDHFGALRSPELREAVREFLAE